MQCAHVYHVYVDGWAWGSWRPWVGGLQFRGGVWTLLRVLGDGSPVYSCIAGPRPCEPVCAILKEVTVGYLIEPRALTELSFDPFDDPIVRAVQLVRCLCYRVY